MTSADAPKFIKNLRICPLSAVAPAAAFATPTRLPDKQSFCFTGTFLNAAFAYPLGVQGYSGAEAFLQARMHEPTQSWPRINPRNAAVAAFAGLINAAPTEVAVVPFTLGGETRSAQHSVSVPTPVLSPTPSTTTPLSPCTRIPEAGSSNRRGRSTQQPHRPPRTRSYDHSQRNHIRISPSGYNDMEDIDRLIAALKS